MPIKKIIAAIAILFVFAWMLHRAGAETFLQGFALSCALAFALFAWDTFFLDWVLFPNIRRIHNKEYHQKWFHVKACLPMVPIFAALCCLSSPVMLWLW